MSLEVLDFGGGQLEIVEQDTCYVVCNDVGLQGARGESGYISSILGLYRIQTTVGGEPTSGHIRYNNATQTSATILTVHGVTQDDIDVEIFLSLLATGTPLIIQDKDDYTNYQIWEISATLTENPSYFSIPVTLTSSGGTGTTGFANNHQVFFAAFGGGGGGGGTWGSITGTLSNQTDLQTALDAKVDENSAIVGATKTKITYDTKGLVTAGADATTADINDSSNRRYVTDAQLAVIGNTSGTNSGDQTITLTGEVTGTGTGSFAATVKTNLKTHPITLTIDGAGGPVTTGLKAYWRCPYDCTIVSWTLLADVSTSTVIDVWKDTYANYPPTNDDSMTNGNEPEISAATKAEDTDLGNWTTVAVTAGDVFAFNVDSNDNATKLVLILEALKT